jgi:predicted nuclease with TOPRIM domain
MITFLNEVSKIGGVNALIFLIIFLFAIREGYNFCAWIKTEILDRYHKKSEKAEQVEERFEELKKINKKEDEEIGSLKQEMDVLRDRVDDMKD